MVLAFLLDRMRDALPVPAAAILLVQGRALTTVAADGLALAVGEDAAPLLGSEAAAMLAAPELGQWAVADLHRVGGQGADVGTGIGTPPVPGALRALLGVSLYVEGRRVGVLAAGEAERRSWTREDLSLVAGLAPVAEGELRRARREQHQRAAGNASRPCLAADNPTPRASSHTAGEAGEERAITGADPARRTGKPRLRPVPGGIAPGT
ncbi:MAG: GAF domain-containing protein [Pseudomonadota bacterium]